MESIRENFSKYSKQIYIGAAIVVILVGVVYLFRSKIARFFGTKYVENMENAEGSAANSAELMLFTVDWCPHCKNAQPQWNALVSQYTDKQINNTVPIFTEINCTNESPDVSKQLEKYNVQGYPTIKLLLNGNVIDYDAKVTTDNLVQFLQSTLP